ncbi:hypothetical protein CLOSTMETH_01799 [[Clostridium] methylpentosum DSM 5476]|uniref:Uncharacterized protein n=1 Tax=[Clostridium] methylpentosum DSM 5476 TaxID=537013 RepID=C0ED73_9FIRM|nr:hypothetical protein CLOSTMETH_01799 [[Clostridium] methylpentosum DSM 5476]
MWNRQSGSNGGVKNRLFGGRCCDAQTKPPAADYTVAGGCSTENKP